MITTSSTGNRMDKSAIWENNARQQEICTRLSRGLFELLQVQFFPKMALWSMELLINRHDLHLH